MALKSKSSKFDMNIHGVLENPEGRAKSSLVQKVIGTVDSGENYDSRVLYQDIEVDRITPRSINQYRQNRIERLAKSIRNTNNRLIHPIVLVRAADLPAGHEVLRRFAQQGVDTSKLEYIIVAGERRFRAWQLLRKEEAERIKDQLGAVNRFDTITANVLSHEEAYNEERYFEDSNIEARQLTPLEGILHIRAALEEVQTDEQKREALIAMADGDTTGIPEEPEKAAKKFNAANYCLYYLSAELGIEGWSLSTVKAYMSVVNNSPEEVIDAVIDGKYKASAAREGTGFSAEEQLELLHLWLDGNTNEYKRRLEELKEAKKNKKAITRYTYRDARRELDALAKQVQKSREQVTVILESLGAADKAKTQKALKRMDAFARELEAIGEQLQ